MGFVANFIRFPAVEKNFENLLRVDKVTESLKVGTFLRNSVVCVKWDIKPYLHTHLYHP